MANFHSNYLRKSTNIRTRLSLEQIQTDPVQWSLFIQAYSAMQQQSTLPTTQHPKTEQTSHSGYFGNIAGIHGLPNRPFPGEEPDSKPPNGYCAHGIPTFPTWHRAYVKTVEQALQHAAGLVLANYNPAKISQDVLDQLTKGVDDLRFPYWDWENPDPSHIITDIIHQETITIPLGFPNATPKEITNPLRSFVNFEDINDVYQGSYNNPSSRPNYNAPINTVPYTPKGYPTIRHPTKEYLDDTHKMKLVGLEYHSKTLVPGMYQMFSNDDYYIFSNHSCTRTTDNKEGYGLYSSLEVYHDTIHDALGGNGGHMAYPPIAAFDPMFFLHHCNVDRLFALWQRCHPEKFFGDVSGYNGYTVDPVNNPLSPFWDAMGEKNVTSTDMRNWKDWGYDYSGPFFDAKFDTTPQTLLHEVLRYYQLYSEFPYVYSVDVEHIEKNKYAGPYKIRVFIGDNKVDQNTPTDSKYFAGAISVFARGNEVSCENCEGAFIRGNVTLNNTLWALGYDITIEDGQDLSEQSQMSTQLKSFSDQIVLIAVDQGGRFLYRYVPADGKENPVTVTVKATPNYMSDDVHNDLINNIKAHIGDKIDTSKLSGRRIINLLKKIAPEKFEALVTKFYEKNKIVKLEE